MVASPILYWTIAPSTIASILVAASDVGVCYLAFLDVQPHRGFVARGSDRGSARGSDVAVARLAEYFPDAVLQQEERLRGLRESVIAAIEQPLQPSLQPRGGIPLDMRGNANKKSATDFQKKIWSQLCHIPCGETRSYADIAKAIGQPKAAQAVGGANAANIIPVLIPCHRVVNTGSGKLGGYAYGLNLKQRLLEGEGAWPPARLATHGGGYNRLMGGILYRR